MGEELQAAVKAWDAGVLRGNLASKGERRAKSATDSGIPVNRIYTPLDLE